MQRFSRIKHDMVNKSVLTILEKLHEYRVLENEDKYKRIPKNGLREGEASENSSTDGHMKENGEMICHMGIGH
jgi:hypothetical protein